MAGVNKQPALCVLRNEKVFTINEFDTQNTANSALGLVKAFFASKERHDLDATLALFSDDAVYIFPLAASGKQENWFTYEGKEAVTKYQGQVLEHFKQIKMLETRYFVSTDGENVFVESRGDSIAQDGTAYNNVYIFKFVIRDGKIAEGV